MCRINCRMHMGPFCKRTAGMAAHVAACHAACPHARMPAWGLRADALVMDTSAAVSRSGRLTPRAGRLTLLGSSRVSPRWARRALGLLGP